MLIWSMEFLRWHYKEGIQFYLGRYSYFLRSIIQYFSLTLLLTSLFAPWKRLIVVEKKSGFDIAASFADLSFNLVSRGIGAVVRIFLFITGVVALLLFSVFGFLGLVVWLLIPFLSVAVYEKYINNPMYLSRELWRKMASGSPAESLMQSRGGEFLSAHLGVPKEAFVKAAKPIKIGSGSPISFEEIISSLLEMEIWDNMFLREYGLKKDDLLMAAKWWDKKMQIQSISLAPPQFYPTGLGRDLLFGYTPILKQYSTDMAMTSDFSHHLIGRAQAVSRMERTLSGGKSIILIGEPGVGKKTAVYEFAHKAFRGELGHELSYRKVLELDYNFVFSESVDKNRKKQLLSNIFEEASMAGNIILVLRDLHRLTAQSLEGMDLTDVLETHLERGKLKIISISTREDYEKYLARNARLRKFFETVEVLEPTEDEAREILLEAADTWEKKKKIVVTVPALNKILFGSEKYITDTPFPEKALELLDAVVFLEEQKGADNTITVDDVNAALSEKTGISFTSLDKDESSKLANLEEIIHERLVDQEEAVSLISKILRSKALGIVDTKRPTGSFLFLGPTGVGKTETAKVLAKVYFGSTEKIIRFDMAEYVGREGLERLIGSVDKSMPGALTTAIKNNPASLLLLDEIEKAPSEIFNLFLSILDEGFITDAFDKKVNCRNLFVIATSNAGAEYIRQLVNDKQKNLQEKVVEFILKDGKFSPEFINRFDGVVVYEPLSFDNLVKVARILLSEIVSNLEKRNIKVLFTEEAITKLAKDGFEPEFGARPMRRIIELSIGDLLGKALLSEKIKPGDSVRVLPGRAKGEFTWEKQA